MASRYASNPAPSGPGALASYHSSVIGHGPRRIHFRDGRETVDRPPAPHGSGVGPGGRSLPNRLERKTARVDGPTSLPQALRAIGLDEPRPTLVVTGGADALTKQDMERLRPLFVESLAPLAERLHAYVLDGGTDSGIMRLMGETRAELNANFPLIGVAAEGTVGVQETPSADPGAMLEPHHTHFVLVPGVEWGDESPWIALVASALAGRAGSITVLVDGGDISWEDVSHSVDAHRRVFVVAGSGRLADTLDRALDGRGEDERATEMARSGLLEMIDPLEHPERTASMLEKSLVGSG